MLVPLRVAKGVSRTHSIGVISAFRSGELKTFLQGSRQASSSSRRIAGRSKTAFYKWILTAIVIHLGSLGLPSDAAQQSPHTRTQSKSGTKAATSIRLRNTESKEGYVGSKVCGSCHRNIYGSFRQTSMGRSMLPGDTNFLASLPAPARVYDKDSNQYFELSRKDGGLFQSQYSLDSDGKVILRQDWKLDYVMGAGENGFGFLIRRDRYLFEAPLSYYTKTQSWGFSPGFQIQNRGFSRPILGRCIVCHSGRPNPVVGQVGLYKDPPFDELAVGCENCHGPGELHVVERTQDQVMGVGVVPKSDADTGIVNPARLSGWLADNICMRCHQGQDVRIEMPGKTVQDFRPGMQLGKYVSIFKVAPEASTSPSALPLEHYFGMTISKCYQSSRNLHCITCHDPHAESSGAEAIANYRAQCLRCHGEQGCRLDSAKRLATTPPDDCLTCHMPKRKVTTIAHAALTDHSIPARASSAVAQPEQSDRAQKPELLVLTAPPDEWKRLESVPQEILFQAYDNLIREGHREFEPPMTHMLPQMLGSTISDPAVLRALARAEFSKNTPSGTLKAIDYMRRVLGVTLPNIDDSLFLADLYARTQQERKAIEILEKARTASPYFREVYELLANDYMNLGQYGDAIDVLRQGIKLFPDDEKLRSLGKKADSVTLGPAK